MYCNRAENPDIYQNEFPLLEFILEMSKNTVDLSIACTIDNRELCCDIEVHDASTNCAVMRLSDFENILRRGHCNRTT